MSGPYALYAIFIEPILSLSTNGSRDGCEHRADMLTSHRDSAVTTVSQSLLYTGSESGKLLALRNLIFSGDLPYPSLIFVQSVARAEELYKTLALDGIRVDVVHGNRGKAKRDEAITEFRQGRVWMLVVTEVLARGMDFRGVKVVVNYGRSRLRHLSFCARLALACTISHLQPVRKY